MQQNKQFMESGSIMAVHIILYILVLKIYIFPLHVNVYLYEDLKHLY